MKKTKSHKRLLTVGGLLFIFLLGALVVSLVQISEINVSGNNKYDEEEVVNILFSSRWDKNTIFCYLKDKTKEHATIPFVEAYKIEFQGLNKVDVIIYEKSVVGYIEYMGSYMYFDKDGIIVESSNEKLDGIPLITGLNFGYIVLHNTLPVDNEQVFNEILNLTQLLSSHNLLVDKIYFDNKLNATLYIEEVAVYLGDNEDIDGKISELNDMLPQLAGRSGTLYLDTYDENNNLMGFGLKEN